MHKTDNVGWTMRHNDNGSSCGVCRLLSVESQIVCRVPFLAGRDTKFWFVSYALLYVPRVVCLYDGLGGTLFRWWRCQCQWPARSSVIDWPSLFGCHTQDMHEIFFFVLFLFSYWSTLATFCSCGGLAHPWWVISSLVFVAACDHLLAGAVFRVSVDFSIVTTANEPESNVKRTCYWTAERWVLSINSFHQNHIYKTNGAETNVSNACSIFRTGNNNKNSFGICDDVEYKNGAKIYIFAIRGILNSYWWDGDFVFFVCRSVDFQST